MSFVWSIYQSLRSYAGHRDGGRHHQLLGDAHVNVVIIGSARVKERVRFSSYPYLHSIAIMVLGTLGYMPRAGMNVWDTRALVLMRG